MHEAVGARCDAVPLLAGRFDPVPLRQRREVANPIRDPHIVIETEAVEVPLNRVDRVIDHDLLKAGIRSVVLVDTGRFIRIRCVRLASGKRNQIDEFAFERSCGGIQPE